ncbi:MAG: prolipoprotein diacylglyceryl transferase family protein, partial [Arachnia propionica]
MPQGVAELEPEVAGIGDIWHPGEIFAVWNGGIAIYGGLLAGALVLYLFS